MLVVPAVKQINIMQTLNKVIPSPQQREERLRKTMLIYPNYHKGLTDSGQQHLEASIADCVLAVWHQEDQEL